MKTILIDVSAAGLNIVKRLIASTMSKDHTKATKVNRMKNTIRIVLEI